MRRRSLLSLLPIPVVVQVLPLYASEVLLDANRRQLLYEFHSGLWMNLHHLLYEQAEARRARAGGGLPTQVKARLDALLSQIDTLPAAPRRIWNDALEAYERVWVRRDLLFDDGMTRIKLRLAEREASLSLVGASLPDDLRRALQLAAPVYRKHWWPEHDRNNRQKADDLARRVQELGLALTGQLAALYRSPWPSKGRLRVEMAPYAGFGGAYTSLDPTFTVYQNTDPRKRDWLGLEILFHETSHAMIAPVETAITRSCQKRGRAVPEDLWHVLLFYTTGEAVRQALARRGIEGYVQYADANGVYGRAGWLPYRQALALHWQPYIDGQADFDGAIAGIVDALPPKPTMDNGRSTPS
ncbi:hypothetical protein [Gloeobacter violaceus]|nr:hypothetical protein [Gloeobacter violaceus]